MSLHAKCSALVMLVLVLLVMKIEGESTAKEVHENDTNSTSLMEKDVNQITGCAGRPFVCSRGEFPTRFMCCGDRCVDVTADNDNCGICGFRCLFNRQCCNRLCVNTNRNIFNCGGCGRVCPFGRLCVFGVCAFEQSVPVPPFLVPLPPTPPFLVPMPPTPVQGPPTPKTMSILCGEENSLVTNA
ncbi:hypothetical protein ACSQ67_017669 [Phaseolus vulgaris]